NPRLDPADAGWPGAAPEVSMLSQGYQYLTETRFDQLEPILEIVRRDVVALGLPLRSVEIELGPSQCEFTFHPQLGLAPADAMMLFRSAVKQTCRRQGYHASFMCRPKLPNVMSSGWHLHQSLRERRTNTNAFAGPGSEQLSPLGRQFLAGLLAHARAAAAAIRRRGWKTGQGSPPPIRICTWPPRSSLAWTASRASSIPAPRRTRRTRLPRRCCRRRWTRHSPHCARMQFSPRALEK